MGPIVLDDKTIVFNKDVDKVKVLFKIKIPEATMLVDFMAFVTSGEVEGLFETDEDRERLKQITLGIATQLDSAMKGRFKVETTKPSSNLT